MLLWWDDVIAISHAVKSFLLAPKCYSKLLKDYLVYNVFNLTTGKMAKKVKSSPLREREIDHLWRNFSLVSTSTLIHFSHEIVCILMYNSTNYTIVRHTLFYFPQLELHAKYISRHLLHGRNRMLQVNNNTKWKRKKDSIYINYMG